MSKDTSSVNADDAVQESVESPSSASDLIRSALGGDEQPKVEETVDTVEADEEEVEESTEATEDEAGDAEESTEDNDVLSQIDFEAADEDSILAFGSQLADALSPQQAALISQAIGSKGGSEYGKMRSELKKAHQLNEEILSKINPNSNEFSSITSEDDLSEKETDIQNRLDYFQSKAMNGEWDYNDEGDEGVSDANGNFYPKKVVADGVKILQKQIRDVDKQRQSIREEKLLPKLETAELEKAEQEISWFKDTDSKQYQEYKKLVDDPSIDLIKKVAPKVHAKLSRLLAHAVNSIEGVPAKKVATRLPLKKSGVKAIGSVASGTQGINRSGNRQSSKIKERIQSGNYGKGDVSALIAASLG
jgi:hypothetical protein